MDIWKQKNIYSKQSLISSEIDPLHSENHPKRQQFNKETELSRDQELDKICRGCMNTESLENFHSIFAQNLDALFQNCTGLQVDRLDKLPNAICHNCYEGCRNWLELRDKCKESELKFLKCLSEMQPHCEGDQVRDLEDDCIDYVELTSDEYQIITDEDETVEASSINGCYDAVSIKNDLLIIDFKDTSKITSPKSRILKLSSSVSNTDPNLSQLECNVCQKKFSSPKKFEEHKEFHVIVQDLKCRKCDCSFKYQNELRRHCRIAHPGERIKNFACNECDREFLTFKHLKDHKASRHEGKKNELCTHCGKLFFSACNLNTHIERFHSVEEIIYKCSQCFKTFKSLSALHGHMQYHRTNQKFECKICNKVFKQKYTLQAHQLVHLDAQLCNLCGRGFKSAFQDHVKQCKGPPKDRRKNRIRNRPKPVCPLCAHESNNITAFHEHLQDVHVHDDGVDLAAIFESVKQEKCEDCGKRYFDRIAVLAHQYKVHKAKRVACPNCGRWLRDRDSLQLHLITVCGVSGKKNMQGNNSDKGGAD